MYKRIEKTKTKTVKEFHVRPSDDDDDEDDETEYEVPEGIDIVLLDVPLMIRLLEYAREEATSDVDLHELAAKLITKSNKWKSWKPLTMEDYTMIVPATRASTPVSVETTTESTTE